MRFKIVSYFLSFCVLVHLGILGSLQLLLQVVQVVSEAGDLQGELLLEGVTLLDAEASLVLVLLLPVGVLGLPLADRALKVDLDLPQLLDLDHQGLDVPLQGGDLGLGSIAAENRYVWEEYALQSDCFFFTIMITRSNQI